MISLRSRESGAGVYTSAVSSLFSTSKRSSVGPPVADSLSDEAVVSAVAVSEVVEFSAQPVPLTTRRNARATHRSVIA
jgi:hypothetical protein